MRQVPDGMVMEGSWLPFPEDGSGRDSRAFETASPCHVQSLDFLGASCVQSQGGPGSDRLQALIACTRRGGISKRKGHGLTDVTGWAEVQLSSKTVPIQRRACRPARLVRGLDRQ